MVQIAYKIVDFPPKLSKKSMNFCTPLTQRHQITRQCVGEIYRIQFTQRQKERNPTSRPHAIISCSNLCIDIYPKAVTLHERMTCIIQQSKA